MTLKFFSLITAILILTGKAYGQYCTNDSRYTEAQFFSSTEITIGTNIQYGLAQDFMGNPDSLVMDLYYPSVAIDTSAKRPFIMLFHGGGFSSGDKQSGDIRDLCIHLAMRGFVCASVNYRLGHDFSEYGQYKARYRAIQDGNAALRFVVNNANTVRIDTNWLFVGGQSAGALLALGMVYADQSELDSISLLYNAVATSIELGNLHTSGNNLTNTFTIKGIFNNWGGVVQTEMDGDEMIPTIAFHGALDTTVRIGSDNSFAHYTLNGSEAVHNYLIANNTCSEITIDTLGEHGIFRNASSLFRAQRASCFFKSVFCNTCSNNYTTDSIPANCSNPAGLDKTSWSSNIVIYPNPFETSFTIRGVEDMVDINIYNGYGQLVYKDKIYNGTIQPDILPGIYFVTLKPADTRQSYTTRLIKN